MISQDSKAEVRRTSSARNPDRAVAAIQRRAADRIPSNLKRWRLSEPPSGEVTTWHALPGLREASRMFLALRQRTSPSPTSRSSVVVRRSGRLSRAIEGRPCPIRVATAFLRSGRRCNGREDRRSHLLLSRDQQTAPTCCPIRCVRLRCEP